MIREFEPHTLFLFILMELQELRLIIRRLVEDVKVGENGEMQDDGDSMAVTIELVDDYIKKHKISAHSHYGNVFDYILPVEAKEYFDYIGFKGYKLVKVRSKNISSPWQTRVMVELWHGDL